MDILRYNDYQDEDSSFLLDALVYGTAAELMYIDEAAKVRFKLINPSSCFGIYDNSLTNDLLYFVRWYKANEWDNSNTYNVDVYSDNDINTTANRGSIAYVGKDYTVKMVQQAFDYLDEDFMKDNLIVDMGIKGATQVMTNKMTSDFYSALAEKNSGSELVKGITFAKGGALNYDVIVDAISELNLEDESKIFIVIPNAWKADLRKDDDYKSARQGEVIYNG